jgi:hypothetical protein
MKADPHTVRAAAVAAEYPEIECGNDPFNRAAETQPKIKAKQPSTIVKNGTSVCQLCRYLLMRSAAGRKNRRNKNAKRGK